MNGTAKNSHSSPTPSLVLAAALAFFILHCAAPVSYNLPSRNSRRVYSGLEVFIKEKAGRYAGKEAVLVTNHSGVDLELRRNIDLLREQRIRISLVLAPEHGLYGYENEYDRQLYHVPAGMNAVIYNMHNLEPHSLRRLLSSADVVIFDIQDMGMRCYTYISNLKEIMDAMRGTKTEFIVLDRPNPLGFLDVDGPYLETRHYSRFVSAFPSTFIYNMTMGEAARYYRGEFARDVRLTVVPLKNYRRDMLYNETMLPWIPPSPNLPTFKTSIIYASIVMLEGTNLSVGRGTTKPFEYFGAPWIEPDTFARGLSKLELPCFRFRPVYFSPTFSKYRGMRCGGVQIFYVGGAFSPTGVSYAIIGYIKKMYPYFQWESYGGRYSVDFLAGTDAFRRFIDEGRSYEEFERKTDKKRKKFDAKRKRYLLY